MANVKSSVPLWSFNGALEGTCPRTCEIVPPLLDTTCSDCTPLCRRDFTPELLQPFQIPVVLYHAYKHAQARCFLETWILPTMWAVLVIRIHSKKHLMPPPHLESPVYSAISLASEEWGHEHEIRSRQAPLSETNPRLKRLGHFILKDSGFQFLQVSDETDKWFSSARITIVTKTAPLVHLSRS